MGAVSLALLLAGCNNSHQTLDQHLSKARVAFAAKNFSVALDEANQAIKADTRNREARLLAGEIQESLGDSNKAFAEFARADAIEGKDLRAKLKLIRMLVDANMLDAASTRIASALGTQPDNSDALAFRAVIEGRHGNPDKARADAQAVLATVPDHAVANAVMANLALDGKDPAGALGFLDRGLASQPDNATLLQLRARAFLDQKAPDKAIDTYRTLVAALPQAPGIRRLMAEIQADAGDVAAGEQTLRDGVAAAPRNEEMRLQLVAFLATRRDTASAETELRSASAAMPEDSTYDLVLAAQMSNDGKVDDALSLLRATIARQKDGASRRTAEVGLARFLLAKPDVAAARTMLEDILKAAPDNDDALLLRAGLRIDDGDGAGAVQDLLPVTARQPAGTAAFAELARAYVQQNKTDEAIDALKRIADLSGTEVGAALRLAEAQRSAGRLADATATMTEFVRRNPTSLDGRMAEIRLLLIGKNWIGAQARLEDLRQQPDTDALVLRLTAETKEARGLPSEAAAAYKRLMTLNGAETLDEPAAQNYARTAVAAGQGTAAASYLAGLAKTRSAGQAAAVNLALGTVHNGMGDAGKSIQASDAVIQAAPNNPVGYLRKAASLLKGKDFAGADAAIDAGLAAGAPRAQMILARAMLQSDSGQTDVAIGTYRDAVAANPQSIVAANNLVSLLSDRRPVDKIELAETRDHLQKIAGVTDPTIADTLAWASYRLGHFEAAKTLMLQGRADRSDEAQIKFHYGAVLIAMGDKPGGTAVIRSVMGKSFVGKDEADTLLK